MAGRCKPVGRKVVRGAEQEVAAKSVQERTRPLTPGQCRAYMRRELAKEFESIVNGFIESAKAGNCQHVKLATELLEPRKRQTRKVTGQDTLQRWVAEIEREE